MLPNKTSDPPHTGVFSDPDFILPGEEIEEEFRETTEDKPPRPDAPPGTPTEPQLPDSE